MFESKSKVEEEVREYVKNKTKKNRGGITSIEVKLNSEIYPSATIRPNVVVGAFVTFDRGDRIFVYRFENKVNNFSNGRGYGTYSGGNTDRKVRETIEGWNLYSEPPLK